MPRKHVLKFLIEKCKAYTLELAKVFPLDTEEEKHLFELLERSYIEARYNDKFVVPKEVVDCLLYTSDAADELDGCLPETIRLLQTAEQEITPGSRRQIELLEKFE